LWRKKGAEKIKIKINMLFVTKYSHKEIFGILKNCWVYQQKCWGPKQFPNPKLELGSTRPHHSATTARVRWGKLGLVHRRDDL